MSNDSICLINGLRNKANKVYKGKKPYARAKAKDVIACINQGFTRESAAKQCNISLPSVYRILKEHRKSNPDTPIKGSRSNKKIAILRVWMSVENNSKFVRGKNESRRQIEESVFMPYAMEKPDKDGYDYILKVPYENDDDLNEQVDEIMSEASSIADLRNGFVEMDIKEPATNRSW